MGHAESACGQDLVDRIARWVDQATRPSAASRAADPDASGITVPLDSTPDAAA